MLTISPEQQASAISPPVSDELFDHPRGLDAGQALVEPLVAEGEPLMVEAQEPEHGGVEVVDVHGVLDDVVGELVGFAVDGPGPRAAAGHPHGEAAGVMVAAVVVVAQAALRIDRPAELAAPDDEGLVEQPACLQVADQSPARLVDVAALARAAGRRR